MPDARTKLMVYKMSHDAIPEGGGLADGIKFLSSKESITAGGSTRKPEVGWVSCDRHKSGNVSSSKALTPSWVNYRDTHEFPSRLSSRSL